MPAKTKSSKQHHAIKHRICQECSRGLPKIRRRIVRDVCSTCQKPERADQVSAYGQVSKTWILVSVATRIHKQMMREVTAA